MLVNLLLLLSACISSGVTYGTDDKNKYSDLLNLLYERYKIYKRDQGSLDNFKYQYDNKRNNDKASSTKDNIVIENDLNLIHLGYGGTHESAKRDNIPSHPVTAIHEDDDAAKRGLSKVTPSMDSIIPVHDDEDDAVIKHIVPIHDDMDVEGNSDMDNKDTIESFPDDSKTFITVVEGNGNTIKDENLLSKNVNVVDDSDGDEDGDGDEEKGPDLFKKDGTFGINDIDNILELQGTHDHLSNASMHSDTMEERTIQMPGVAPHEMDTYLCFAHKLPTGDRYIVEYEPLAEKQTAHHMLLFGCDEPFQETGVWSCREMAPVCKGRGQSIMYAWAKNAPSLKMPTDVGMHVGGQSGFKYLVLQVHYLHVQKFKDGKTTDNSGVRFHLDKTKKRFLAGIYLLANGFTPIPPHKSQAFIDMGCYYPEGPKFFPFRFRVHAHKLGTVITGYRVRDGIWKLIGRGDPQRPQAFYRVFHDIEIQPGDTIMGRCTYNSTSREKTTYIGATHADEMCNFYIMYFYDSDQYYKGPEELQCEGASSELFQDFPKNSSIPLSAMEEGNRIKYAQYGLKDLAYVPVHNWPVYGMNDGELPLTVGQIVGVDLSLDESEVIILHRANRFWGSNTFDASEVLNKTLQVPIPQNTIIWIDSKTGAVKRGAGKDMFYLPHGITIDKHGNIWITDVGSHQVYKIDPDMNVLLTLGEKFKPGYDNKHFCKPTDVVILDNDDFYVSDGYCNKRVVKFNSKGEMLMQISADKMPNIHISDFPSPKDMSVVHSLSLDRLHNRLFVADRENARILIFNSTTGKYMNEIKSPSGAVYGVAYNKHQGGVLHFITGPRFGVSTFHGYTFSFASNSIVTKWNPVGGFALPHDLAVSKDNEHIFVVEIKSKPYKVWKFQRIMKIPSDKVDTHHKVILDDVPGDGYIMKTRP